MYNHMIHALNNLLLQIDTVLSGRYGRYDSVYDLSEETYELVFAANRAIRKLVQAALLETVHIDEQEEENIHVAFGRRSGPSKETLRKIAVRAIIRGDDVSTSEFESVRTLDNDAYEKISTAVNNLKGSLEQYISEVLSQLLVPSDIDRNNCIIGELKAGVCGSLSVEVVGRAEEYRDFVESIFPR
jgi:hypothetical protein